MKQKKTDISLKEKEKKVRDLRPIDDVFFEVLADDIEFCQEMLRIILSDDKLIVVYISQFDIFKANHVLYHVDNTVRETGSHVDDGLYRVFVNTEVKDGTTISEYMECFLEKEVNNSKFPTFTSRMNMLKHEERGLDAVCEVMEKYEEKAVEEGLSLFEKAITMLADGKTPSEVVLMGIPQSIVDRATRFTTK